MQMVSSPHINNTIVNSNRRNSKYRQVGGGASGNFVAREEVVSATAVGGVGWPSWCSRFGSIYCSGHSKHMQIGL